MTLPNCLEPENARITIPVLFAIGYALYHWLRWRKTRKEGAKAQRLRGGVKVQNDVGGGKEPELRWRGRVREEADGGKKPALREEVGVQDTADEAERLWTAANAKVHSKIPGLATDWQYMHLLYTAACKGHVEAMSLLGDYAVLREELVEAVYWKQLVELNGGVCMNPTVNELIQRWVEFGCPQEVENVTGFFSERQGDFTRAVLDLKSGIDPKSALVRLKKLAAEGDADAKLFLRKK